MISPRSNGQMVKEWLDRETTMLESEPHGALANHAINSLTSETEASNIVKILLGIAEIVKAGGDAESAAKCFDVVIMVAAIRVEGREQIRASKL